MNFTQYLKMINKQSHGKYVPALNAVHFNFDIRVVTYDNQDFYARYEMDDSFTGEGSIVLFRDSLKAIKNISEIKLVDGALNIDGLSIQPCDFSADDMPLNTSTISPRSSTSTINSDTLKTISPFMSKEATRYHLCGIYFDSEKSALVATDGNKLLKVNHASIEKSFILPDATVKSLTVINDVDFTYGMISDSVYFETDNVLVISKTIDGTFPDYTRIIPDHHTGANISCKVVHKYLTQARKALGKDSKVHVLATDSGVIFKPYSDNMQYSELSIDCANEGFVDSHFDLNILLGVFTPFKNCDDVTYTAAESGCPSKIFAEGITAVVMPMKF